MKNLSNYLKLPMFFVCLFLISMTAAAESKEQKISYESISQEKAHEMMEEQEELLVLDVRTEEEYEEKHIINAVLLPLDEVEERCEEVLPDKEQVILVYCRSGRRSKLASEILAEQGYTNVLEFGGIIDWEYETETGPYVEEESVQELSEKKDENASAKIKEGETETCHHEWVEDCVSKTCSKCGAYQRTDH